MDAFVADAVDGLSRSRAAVLIGEGYLLVDGHAAKPSARLRGGERVEGRIPESEPGRAKPQRIPLDILFEDRDIVVVNKAPGMVVHPGAGNPENTLVNALLAHAADLSGVGGVLRPGIVHRLDKGTSGVIVCAKNDAAHDALTRQFSGRSVHKVYLALTVGVPKPKSGLVERPIGRHPVHRKKMAVDVPRARSAKTQYRVLRERGGLALVECVIFTGRTHQVRVHLQSLGAPILMDEAYGGAKAVKRLAAPAGKRRRASVGRRCTRGKSNSVIRRQATSWRSKRRFQRTCRASWSFSEGCRERVVDRRRRRIVRRALFRASRRRE
ncbi:MAG: RluA family pseudouridine synthase [Deltaproteobacteria bacterium]|nr:RluA family pseudouridine synthase [Deltaproteobacteria bacterium]